MTSRLKQRVRAHPLVAFVLISYVLVWAFLHPAFRILVAAKGSFPPLTLLGLPGAYSPSIAALIVLALTEGRPGVRAVLRKLVAWRVAVRWYMYVLLLPLAVAMVAVALRLRPTIDVTGGLRAFPIAYAIALPFGPLAEELGWRGYFLPRLLQRYSALHATLIVAAVWTVWHFALFIFPGAAIPSFLPVTGWTIALYFFQILGESLIFTYVFFKTGGSVLLAILLHMAFNSGSNIAEGFFPASAHADAARLSIYLTSIGLTLAWAIATWALDRGVWTGMGPPARAIKPEQQPA
jgi:membrane protease YdiL (CAAX protease family)